VNPRNTIAATATFNRMVTTPGTLGVVKDSELVSIIVPFERIYTPDQRIVINTSGAAVSRLALNIAATPALGASYFAASEIYFEEI
jgi:stringent starvation protein B